MAGFGGLQSSEVISALGNAAGNPEIFASLVGAWGVLHFRAFGAGV